MSVEPTKDKPSEGLTGRPAGVLMLVRPLGPKGEPHLVFMRRSQKVHTHKGQISFPGGGFQAEDGTLETTALRETHEELGLHPRSLRVLRPLVPVETIVSNYLIYPFVAVPVDPAAPITYIPDSFEVADILEVPLGQLILPIARRDEEWVMRGEARQVVFYQHGQLVIWGATAYILKNFISEIQQGKWQELFSATDLK